MKRFSKTIPNNIQGNEYLYEIPRGIDSVNMILIESTHGNSLIFSGIWIYGST